DHNGGPNQFQLTLKPGLTGIDLRSTRLPVDPPLRGSLIGHPLEMFHRIGQINLLEVKSQFLESLPQEPARWPHEGMTLLIFLIAGLFTNEEPSGSGRPLSEYRLSGSLVQITTPATVGS